MKRAVAIGFALGVLLVAIPSANAQDENQIRQSIAAATQFLLKQYAGTGPVDPTAPEGGHGDGSHGEGPAALAGIAMLEAGVPHDNQVIQAITSRVRAAAIKQYLTYQLALDIIFLDKIGDTVDTELIQSMGVRLLSGQTGRGGWTYNCPNVDNAEHERLIKLVTAAKTGNKPKGQVGADFDSRPVLSSEILDIIAKKRFVATPGHGDANFQTDDNSNTQFAVLGLWAGRRHGLPVDEAIKGLNKRFTDSQDRRNGGWGYISGAVSMPTPAMTCAGLLALAVNAGNSGERILRARDKMKDESKEDKDPKDVKPPPAMANPLQDPRIVGGLQFLARFIVQPTIQNSGGAGGGQAPSLPGFGQDTGSMDDLYFLWSLERVCMVFSLKEVYGRDWYGIGARYLIATQNKNDGSWRGKYTPAIDTCFGLMFMCRSNVIKDLSNIFSRRLSTKTAPPPTGGGVGPTVKNGKDNPPAKPAASDEPDVSALVKEFVAANGAKQLQLLEKLKMEKGAIYTSALTDSIPQLTGDMQKKAREALAERFCRFSANTLKGYLQSDNPDVRRAAVVAAEAREETELIPDLIASLNDSNEMVWRAARAALKGLSGGKDFGPPPGATEEERKMAIAAWTAWHKKK
jgi:hypothetical protein